MWELLSGAGERLLFYLGLGAALGLLASWLLSRRIKRHTRGLEIAEIASLADHREALLHSIREGVVAVNNDGRYHAAQRQRAGAARRDRRGGRPARGQRRARSRGGRVPVVRRGRPRCRDRHPHPGSGAEPAGGHQSGSADRDGDDDARQHRTGVDAGPAVLAQERHRHAARTDPRVRQPAAHHLRAGPARRVRLGARPGRHPDPAARRDQRRCDTTDFRSCGSGAADREDNAGGRKRGVAADCARVAPRRAGSSAGDRRDHLAGQPDRQCRRRVGGFRRGTRHGPTSTMPTAW